MSELPYYGIPDPPGRVSASTVLSRMVDALGFRYRWATEGLREEDLEFRACPTSMDIGELLKHIYGLTDFIESFIEGRRIKTAEPDGLGPLRERTLLKIWRIREKMLGMDEDELALVSLRLDRYDRSFPIWNMINGPLSDALTHVGQIASWRRINGNPIPGASVFLGWPPSSHGTR